MNKLSKISLFFLALVIMGGVSVWRVQAASAAVCAFTNAANDNLYENAANWNCGHEPNLNDDATIPSSKTAIINSAGASNNLIVQGKLIVNKGGFARIFGDFTVTGFGKLQKGEVDFLPGASGYVGGKITVVSGATLSAAADATDDLELRGEIVWDGTVKLGSGTVTAFGADPISINGSNFTAGQSTVNFRFEGVYSQILRSFTASNNINFNNVTATSTFNENWGYNYQGGLKLISPVTYTIDGKLLVGTDSNLIDVASGKLALLGDVENRGDIIAESGASVSADNTVYSYGGWGFTFRDGSSGYFGGDYVINDYGGFVKDNTATVKIIGKLEQNAIQQTDQINGKLLASTYISGLLDVSEVKVNSGLMEFGLDTTLQGGNMSIASGARVRLLNSTTLHIPGNFTNQGLIILGSNSTIDHPGTVQVVDGRNGKNISTFVASGRMFIKVNDSAANLDGSQADSLVIFVNGDKATGNDKVATNLLTETGPDTGIFITPSDNNYLDVIATSQVDSLNDTFEAAATGNAEVGYFIGDTQTKNRTTVEIVVEPAAPSSVSVGSSLSSTIIRWLTGNGGMGGSETEFILERSDDGGLNFSKIASVPNSTTEYIDKTIKPGETYVYRVASSDGIMLSNYVVADPYTSSPVQPGKPTLDSPTETTFKITVDYSGNGKATRYIVKDNVFNKYLQTDGSWGGAPTLLSVDNLGAANGVITTGAEANTAHWINVQAVAGNNQSQWSDLATIYTKPFLPGAASIKELGGDWLKLNIDPNNNPNVTYKISGTAANSAGAGYIIHEVNADVYIQTNHRLGASPAVLQYDAQIDSSNVLSVSGLQPGNTYAFEVATINTETGKSTAYGPVFSVTTKLPSVNGDSYTIANDKVLSVLAPGVLSNDSGSVFFTGKMTAEIVDQPTHGVVELNSDGSFTYTPEADFIGIDKLTYNGNDSGQFLVGPATVEIIVTGVQKQNTPPVANTDTYSTDQDTVLTATKITGVLVNDTDAENSPLAAIKVSDPKNGALTTFNSDGSFTYTPNQGFSGTDSFTYQANDGKDNSNIGTVNVTVIAAQPKNNTPVAKDDFYSTDVNQQLIAEIPSTLKNDTDKDGDQLQAIKVSDPKNGNVVFDGTNGTFTYTPNTDFVGVDSFTYKANDGKDDSNIATVYITVKGAAQGANPTAPTNAVISGVSDTSLELSWDPGQLSGDEVGYYIEDLDKISGQYFLVAQLTVNGAAPTHETINNLDPNTAHTLRVSSVAYDGTVSTPAVAVEVHTLPYTPKQLSEDKQATTAQSFKLIFDEFDGNPGTMKYAVQETTSGKFIKALDGFGYLTGTDYTDATYQTITDWKTMVATITGLNPDTAYHFVVYAQQTNGTMISASSPELVVKTSALQPVNTPPVANTDTYSTDQDTVLTATKITGVLVNDTDAENSPLAAIKVSDPKNGALTTFNSDGSFTYTPNQGFSGTDSFTYQANDGKDNSNISTVTVTVKAAQGGSKNTPPVANTDTYSTDQDTVLSVAKTSSVLLNDTDAEGDSLIVVGTTQPAHGTVLFNSNKGDFTYQPTAGYVGSDSFIYTVSDGQATSTATVNINVQAKPNSGGNSGGGGGGSSSHGGGGGVGGVGSGTVSVPQNPSISFVVGSLNFSSNSVILNLSATNNPTQLMLGTTSTFSGSSWVPFISTTSWKFGATDTQTIVYAKFKNAGGESAVASSTLSFSRPVVSINAPQEVLSVKISRLDELLVMPELKYGKRHALVKELQTELKSIGLLPKSLRVTNFYGVMTKQAVDKYLLTKLTLDEVIDRVKLGQSGSLISRLQTELKKLGFYPANLRATGYYGKVTAAAIKKYQAGK